MPLNSVVNMVTDEDAELDRMIAQRAAEQEIQSLSVSAPQPVVLKERVSEATHLSEFIETYKPANSHAALEEQVFLARANQADTIEAEDIIFKAIFGKVPAEPYAVYKGIKVYRIGLVEEGEKRDRQTMEQRMFGPKL